MLERNRSLSVTHNYTPIANLCHLCALQGSATARNGRGVVIIRRRAGKGEGIHLQSLPSF